MFFNIKDKKQTNNIDVIEYDFCFNIDTNIPVNEISNDIIEIIKNNTNNEIDCDNANYILHIKLSGNQIDNFNEVKERIYEMLESRTEIKDLNFYCTRLNQGGCFVCSGNFLKDGEIY